VAWYASTLVTELDAELRRVLEEMPDGILAVDEQGRILFANRTLEAMSGYSRSDLVTLRVEDLVPTGERERHGRERRGYLLSASPPRAMGADLDIRLRRRDGSEFPADVALSPIRTATGVTAVIAAVRAKAPSRHRANPDSRVRLLEQDLHERVLQTLFALSLNLQTVAALVPEQSLSQRLEDAVAQVDDVVRDLRNYIFGLRPGILSDPTSSPDQADDAT